MKRIVSLLMSAVIAVTMFILPSAAEEATDTWKTAAEIVSDMKCGWNLANAMDMYSEDIDEYDSFITQFKLIGSYSPKAYDGIWNPSQDVFFSKSGKAELEWDTASITSKNSDAFGGFGIYVNCNTVYEPIKVKVKITKAVFVTDGGKSYDLGITGSHTISMDSNGNGFLKNCVCDGLTTTAQAKKGKLKIKAEITNIDTIMKTVTKEEYYEHYWYTRHLTSQALIEEIKTKGFGAMRIPVTFLNFTDPKTYEIDEQRLARLEELVNYVLDSGIYCIITMDGDANTGGWLTADPTKLSETKKRLTVMWTQIAERFNKYGEKLIFEGFDELMDKDRSWDVSTEEDEAANKLNQCFVDAVRATGNNNAKRVLMVTPYAANVFFADRFVLPKDTAQNGLIVSVHDSTPSSFTCVDSSSSTAKWTGDADKKEIDLFMSQLDKQFIEKGIPVIVTEICAQNKENTEDRVKFAECYASSAAKNNIACLWYDDASIEPQQEFEFTTALIIRSKLEWKYEAVADAFIKGSGAEINLKNDISRCEATSINDREYTGKQIKPSVRVTYFGYRIKKDVDYTVSYKNNKKIGTATLILTGIGDYEGTLKIAFNIIPTKPTIKTLKSTTAGKATITLKKVTGATGYEISYSTAKNGKFTVAATTTKLSSTFRIPKGTYFVKVRAYKTVNGEKIYGFYGAVKEVTIK